MPELEASELTVELMRSSRLDDASMRAEPPRAARPPREGRPDGPSVALGHVAAPGLDIDAVLRARTSIRFYGPDPVARSEVAAVLQAAGTLDATLYPDEVDAGLGLELLVAARRVEGLAPALYASVDGGTALAATGVLPTGADADQLVLQREYAHAPVLVLVLGNLAAAEARHGAHGHRLLLQRAGAVAHAGWLAAIAHGLHGSVFAGLLPGPLRILAGVDGSRRAQLFALSIGPPALVTTNPEPMKDDQQDRQKQLRTASAISMVMTLFVIATTIVIITGADGGIWVAAAFAAIGLGVGGFFGLRGIRSWRSTIG